MPPTTPAGLDLAGLDEVTASRHRAGQVAAPDPALGHDMGALVLGSAFEPGQDRAAGKDARRTDP
ncbi:hypothetical protein [Rhodovulum sulfidophilum]|uniref:Uncharacterized protein n=1 Tax=Rhodovulum sulfidophilum TaxID=35806 RepID=A0ABS1RR14_RHOSU|nr:hypothetical protein [Rhodovulum sulfidophilum]MBL3607449.1 hypothetical protein [Rhodovulum sulfidophilum]MCE8456470.1 hypothetical protein [Rhodovulum sulfidophilum]